MDIAGHTEEATGPVEAGPTAVEVEGTCKQLGSVRELAAAYGKPVLAPEGWPTDIVDVTFWLDQFPERISYRIVAERSDGTTLNIVGSSKQASARLPTGPWRALRDGSGHRCLVMEHGDHVQGVLYADDEVVDLIGYATEDDLARAVSCLRVVGVQPL